LTNLRHPQIESLRLFAERVPHLLPDTGGASATDAKTSPEGADYPALRDQSNEAVK